MIGRSMKVIACALVALSAAACAAWADVRAAYVEGEALVVLGAPTGLGARELGVRAEVMARSVATKAGAQVKSVIGTIAGGSNVYALIASDTKTTEELIAELANDPSVRVASPNRILRIAETTPNDPDYGRLWGMKAIGAPEAWDVSKGDASIMVAVIDTGVQRDHPDLADNIDASLGRNFVGRVTPDDRFDDGNGHGTHVAGTIGAVGNNDVGVAGVSWRTKIIPLRTLGNNGEGSEADVVRALQYVAKLISDDKRPIAAVNLSLGGYGSYPPQLAPRDDPMYKAFKDLSDLPNAPVIVVAAGNEMTEVGAPAPDDVKDSRGYKIADRGSYAYPASYMGIDTMIVVSATRSDNTALPHTNWSEQFVDLCAPGGGIYSTVNGSGYGEKSGTSMATPHVAGAAALLASKMTAESKRWTGRELKARLLATADKDVDPQNSAGPAPQVASSKKISAHGLLSLARALSDDVKDEDLRVEVNPTETKLEFNIGSAIYKNGQAATMAVGPSTGGAMLNIQPPDATRDFTVKWSSSDEPVAVIDPDSGAITAKAVGTTIITATLMTKDMSGTSTFSTREEALTFSARLTVTEAPRPVPPSGGGGCAVGACGAALLAMMVMRRRKSC